MDEKKKNRQIKIQNIIFIILGVIALVIGKYLYPTAPNIAIILVILIAILIFAVSKIYKKKSD